MEGWNYQPLGTACNVFSGNSINAKIKQERYILDVGTPYVATKDVGFNHEIDYENGVRIPEEEESSFRVAPPKCVLLCAEGGSAGRKVAHNTRKAHFVNKLYALVPGIDLDSKLLFYYCITKEFYETFSSLKRGLIGGVSSKKLKSIPIPLPPLPEQERIVAILDEAFAAIATATANAEKNLANARELFESGLEQLTYSGSQNNCLGKLGDCCTIKTGKKDVNEGNPEGEYPFFTCAKEHTYSDVYSFDTEAILVAGNGAVGQTSYYNGKFEAYQRTYVLCDFQDIHVMYLRHLLQAKLAKAVSKTKLGNTMPYIKKGMLTNFEFPLPPIQAQGTIAAKLDALEQHCQDLESEVQQKLDHLTNLKQSLLHKAFTGELTADKKAADRTLSEAAV
jgi:type I restriction enzyme, S subunit